MDWPYRYTPYIWPLLATTAYLWTLALYCWRRRSVPGAAYLASLMFFTGLWALLSAMQLLSADLTTRISWWRVEFSIQILPSIFLFFFVVTYAGLGRWLTLRNLTLIALPTVVFTLLIYTNDLHHWMWVDFIPREYLHPAPGLGTWFGIIYAYLLYLVSAGILIWLFVRFPLYRWPAAVILGGSLFVRIVYILDAAGWSSRWPFDPMILAFNVSATVYALALFYFRIFDAVPLARELVVERMDDGLLVVDTIGRIADLNPTAQTLLAMPRSETIGREARLVLDGYPPLRQLLDDPDVKHVEIQAGADTQWYEAQLSPLLNARGFRLGQLLLLHNVTEQKRTQVAQLERQRLLAAVEERHRVAYELHDDISQALAFINLQAQAVNEALTAGHPQQAGAYLSRLAEVAREIQADVRELISGLMTTISPEHGLVETLRRTVEQFNQKYGIQAELSLVDEGHIPTLEPVLEVQLLRIVQEALTNIRKHACARNVYVALAVTPAEVEVTVEDDGVGFNPNELAGASGTYGLRIMSERAAELGGTFQVSSEPGCGTQVVVRIPVDSKIVEVSP